MDTGVLLNSSFYEALRTLSIHENLKTNNEYLNIALSNLFFEVFTNWTQKTLNVFANKDSKNSTPPPPLLLLLSLFIIKKKERKMRRGNGGSRPREARMYTHVRARTDTRVGGWGCSGLST